LRQLWPGETWFPGDRNRDIAPGVTISLLERPDASTVIIRTSRLAGFRATFR
jgi:hypothetical protein